MIRPELIELYTPGAGTQNFPLLKVKKRARSRPAHISFVVLLKVSVATVKHLSDRRPNAHALWSSSHRSNFYKARRSIFARLALEQFRKFLPQLGRDAEARVFKSFAEIVALAAPVTYVADRAFAAQLRFRVRVFVVAIHESRLCHRNHGSRADAAEGKNQSCSMCDAHLKLLKTRMRLTP